MLKNIDSRYWDTVAEKWYVQTTLEDFGLSVDDKTLWGLRHKSSVFYRLKNYYVFDDHSGLKSE